MSASPPVGMIRIREMTADDVPLGMRLKEQAGWNQTEADWRRMLALEPEGCFVAELDGRPVATTTTCVFDSVAWIAMVLVDEAFRRRGVATRLMEHALDYLERRGPRTIRLDATPLGRAVYEKLGFAVEYELVRLAGIARPTAAPPSVVPATPEHLEALGALDRQVTGTNRRRLLQRLYQERPAGIHVFATGGQVIGYLAHRDGTRAAQLGPVIALSELSGIALCDAGLHLRAQQPVFVDVPTANAAAMCWADCRQLQPQRPFFRMARGQPVCERPAQLWASFGPEKG